MQDIILRIGFLVFLYLMGCLLSYCIIETYK